MNKIFFAELKHFCKIVLASYQLSKWVRFHRKIKQKLKSREAVSLRRMIFHYKNGFLNRFTYLSATLFLLFLAMQKKHNSRVGCLLFSSLFSAEESHSGIGFCGWLLTAISWGLVVVTLPFSLCVCFKVREYMLYRSLK